MFPVRKKRVLQDVGVEPDCLFINLRNSVLGKIIVAVNKIYIISACLPEAGISCPCKAFVLLMNNPDPVRIFFGVFVADRRTAVRRSVINKYYFVTVKALCKNGIDALSQIFFNIVNGNNVAQLQLDRLLCEL